MRVTKIEELDKMEKKAVKDIEDRTNLINEIQLRRQQVANMNKNQMKFDIDRYR